MIGISNSLLEISHNAYYERRKGMGMDNPPRSKAEFQQKRAHFLEECALSFCFY
ncbi:hypothetical protein HMPREF0083_04886 [Aneurinibacillus aneurinilyticus ATCC 12856]|uniref:Uncharacterized protein n=1 Tax=Aneurinibacillus aneurinilyticus ATCC 12856 TaxID=649747 RepID=U1Y8C1_ANEAE|nr:hypothetical protein HMPREF0083_04886 [Aneurinibacillus aneurinilyticus ATCC 12856]